MKYISEFSKDEYLKNWNIITNKELEDQYGDFFIVSIMPDSVPAICFCGVIDASLRILEQFSVNLL